MVVAKRNRGPVVGYTPAIDGEAIVLRRMAGHE